MVVIWSMARELNEFSVGGMSNTFDYLSSPNSFRVRCQHHKASASSYTGSL